MDSLLAELRHSLSWTRRSLRNQTIDARRRAAALEGSEGRRGLRKRGLWRGLAEKLDLRKGFEGEREEDRERWQSDEI